MFGCLPEGAPSGPSASAPLTSPSALEQSFQKRFSDGSALSDASSEWSCVRDKVTGLTWELKQAVGDLRALNNVYSWTDAQTFVNDANNAGFCGVSDWRIPTREELLSIVDRDGGQINSIYFNDISSSGYWTSDVDVNNPLNAWLVTFATANEQAQIQAKAAMAHVRLVRGNWNIGSSKPDSIYDFGVSVVTDKQTGLMWQMTPSAGYDFITAQNEASASLVGGFDDWRLPDINELSSIVAVNQTSVAFNVTAFDLNNTDVLWSSTESGANAIAVDFANGLEESRSKTATASVLFVRKAY